MNLKNVHPQSDGTIFKNLFLQNNFWKKLLGFLSGVNLILSWDSLKDVLKFQFERKLSALDIHKPMKSHRKKQNESFREYLYGFQEIASSIALDEASIIEYFIDGISDSRVIKLVL